MSAHLSTYIRIKSRYTPSKRTAVRKSASHLFFFYKRGMCPAESSAGIVSLFPQNHTKSVNVKQRQNNESWMQTEDDSANLWQHRKILKTEKLDRVAHLLSLCRGKPACFNLSQQTSKLKTKMVKPVVANVWSGRTLAYFSLGTDRSSVLGCKIYTSVLGIVLQSF